MNIAVELDETTQKPLAIYVRLAEGIAADTVEIEENSCYADLDATGTLLGVEFLEPSALQRNKAVLATKYDSQAFRDALEAVTRTLSLAA